MATKLLLIKDVQDLGRSGDIVSVRPGYARNRLLPMGAAVFADKNAIKRQVRLQEERAKQAAEDKKQAEKMAQEFEGKTIETIVKVDHDGHMYGSVSTIDIVRLAQEQLGIILEKHAVQLKHPIKQTGVFNIIVKLSEGVTGAFQIKVKAEGAEEEPSESKVAS